MDNNGVVNEFDILPLATYFYQTGPQRCTAGYGWLPAPFDSLWVSNSAATYADANGDGIIDESDLFGIALNWGKSHGDRSENFELIQVTVHWLPFINLHLNNYTRH